MAYMTEYAKPFVETWEAYKKPDIDLTLVDTDNFRIGWPKPTIYREHEVIHILANQLDVALAEIKRLSELVDQLGKPVE